MADPAPSFELELPQGASAGRFRFLALSGWEALGRLFEFHIRFVSDKPAIDPLKVLGEKVRVSMQTADGWRHFHGHAGAFEHLGPIELPQPPGADVVDLYQYSIVARPWLWFLARNSDCRVFQKLKVPEICDQVFTHYAGRVKKKLDGDYQPWEYCVQYRESDFKFVSRLMEQEGIFYFFEHGKTDHTLRLVDLHGPSAPVKHKLPYVPGRRAARMEQECIDRWTMLHEVQPGAFAIADYDFKKPATPQSSVVKRPYGHPEGRLEVYDYPGAFDSQGEGDSYVRVRLEELRTQHYTVRATCNVRTLAAGDVLELTNPEQAGAAAKTRYLVTEAVFDLSAGLETEGEGPRYACSFSCLPAKEGFRPARITPRPFVQGPQTAVVVGPAGDEIHTDEYGRIKVHFHWDRAGKRNEESSCWIRVSQGWAGKRWGAMFVPRIGQEVIVDFLEGDPDRPIVTGCVYNAEAMPPYPLPGEMTKSTIKTNSSKGGSGFNELRFEDKKGSEQIFLHAERNQDSRVKNDALEWIGHERHLIVKADQKEKVEGDKHLTVKGDQNEKVDGTVSLKVGSDLQQKVGMKHALDAGMEIHLKAGTSVVIEAGMSLTLKVGGNFVNISPAGVAVSGTMVMINSGGASGSGSGCSPVAPVEPKEADDAATGSKLAPPKGTPPPASPPQPAGPGTTVANAQATVLKQAARDGTPFCEKCEAARQAAAGGQA